MSFCKRDIFILIFLWALSIAVYANSLGNGFISDDVNIVLQVPNGVTIAGGIQVLRPLVYYLVYLVGGITPPVLRAGNIVFHIGVVTVLYLLVSKMANRTVGVVSAMLFAVHPILTESVAWISGGVYPQYSFFFLLGLYLYIKARENKIPVFFSVLSYILALLSSEKAVVFPLVLLVYELLFARTAIRRKSFSIFTGITVVYLVMFFSNVSGRITQVEQLSGVSPRLDNPFMYFATAITMYMQLLFWPHALSIYHSDPKMGMSEIFIRLSVFILLIFAILINYKKNRLLCFWLIFSVLALSMTLSPYRITWIVAERYAYLATACATTCVALFLFPLMQKKYARIVIWMLVVLVTLTLGYRTVTRNRDWRSDDTFWLATVQASPENAKAHNSLASVYANHGDIQRAIRELETAVRVQPSYAPAYFNLGVVYESLGETQKAIDYYTQTLVHNPKELHAQEALRRLVTQ